MPGRVLIVDDDPAQRALLEVLVGTLGYATETAGGGEAALARLARSDALPFSAMILDLVMPDLDGMAVLERLARIPLPPPVIVQASPRGADNVASALRAGARDFLVKPASPERLEAALAEAMRAPSPQGESAGSPPPSVEEPDPRPAPAPRNAIARLLDERGEIRPFDAIEEDAIRFALDHCRGRMSEAARRLGIGRSTLYRKLKDYGIASPFASPRPSPPPSFSPS